jgi:dTDP-L-rhamnose 4-epimerase
MYNPYFGISSIFASNVINEKPVEIYEDGLESRDFVHVKDVVQACILAMDSSKADNEVFNVGSGQIVSILELARTIIKKLNSNIEPKIVGKYRIGDIRHLHMDISKIKRVLGFEPLYSFSKGVNCFINWVKSEKPADFYKCHRFGKSCNL